MVCVCVCVCVRIPLVNSLEIIVFLDTINTVKLGNFGLWPRLVLQTHTLELAILRLHYDI